MKKMKRLAALFLAVVMIMAMGMTVAAKEVIVNSDLAKNPASITITNAKNGVTYKVYKLFDATETGSGEDAKIAYTVITGKSAPNQDTTGFKTDANGNVTAVNEEQEDLTPTQVAALKEYALEVNEMVASDTADGHELVFKGLPYGYYMVIRDAAGDGNAAVTINSTTPNMEIFDKNTTKPEPEPGIKVKQADNDMVAVGGEAHYTVEFATTNYEIKKNPATNKVENNKIYQYTIKDTVEGGFLNNIVVDSVKVYENGKDKDATLIDPTPAFENGVMKIKWTQDGTKDTDHKYKDGSILEIKYHGTVNDSIKDGEKNTNKVEIGWNGSTEPIKGEEDVYTASITIDKINGVTQAKLAGAKFVLLDKSVAKDGDSAGVIPEGTKYYTIATDGKIGTGLVSELTKENGDYKWPDTAVKTTDNNGAATFKGLDPTGDYYLLEVEAPTGFNKLVGTTPVTIEPVKTTGTDAEIAASIENLKVNTQVENNAGAVLPSTGGIGTTIFYVVGGIMVLGAGVLLITKKRMSAK